MEERRRCSSKTRKKQGYLLWPDRRRHCIVLFLLLHSLELLRFSTIPWPSSSSSAPLPKTRNPNPRNSENHGGGGRSYRREDIRPVIASRSRRIIAQYIKRERGNSRQFRVIPPAPALPPAPQSEQGPGERGTPFTARYST